ncbi:MAG: hypothetical protein JO223_06360 [Hyphomicrobiales bacterium]|nr:hypothetical protein [Hyphomicrobiales bacterium]
MAARRTAIRLQIIRFRTLATGIEADDEHPVYVRGVHSLAGQRQDNQGPDSLAQRRAAAHGDAGRVRQPALRLGSLPTLRLDNREIIGAQLVPIDDLHKVPLTGPVQAYVRGQFSQIESGAAQSFS